MAGLALLDKHTSGTVLARIAQGEGGYFFLGRLSSGHQFDKVADAVMSLPSFVELTYLPDSCDRGNHVAVVPE